MYIHVFMKNNEFLRFFNNMDATGSNKPDQKIEINMPSLFLWQLMYRECVQILWTS